MKIDDENFTEVLYEAVTFATNVHRGQKYGNVEYIHHLAATAATLMSFHCWEPELIVAAWLHDTLEDTDATLEDLESRFGARVAALVDAVTDGPGGTRKERKMRPYKLIPTVPGAVTLKIADRLANVTTSIVHNNTKYAEMYAEEHDEFRTIYYCIPADDTATHLMAITLTQHLAPYMVDPLRIMKIEGAEDLRK